MAKRFKLRIPSFPCCRSNDISTDSPPPPSQKTHHSSLSRHVSSAFTTVGCGSRSPNSDEDRNDGVLSTQKRRLRKKKTSLRLRISTSSAESGIFSSESFDERDDEETETLVSISDDGSSSEFNPQLETIREKPHKKRKKKKKKKREIESPARLSVFERLIPCAVEGKIRESYAVVKKSEDPYEDFKRSMMEMIMEKEMFDDKDNLEQLLHCLLSLNHREHHGVIVEAFSEIWQSLFCRTSTSRTSSESRK